MVTCRMTNLREVLTLAAICESIRQDVEVRGIPHLAKYERDTPDFLYAAPDTTARAAFIKESRRKLICANKLYRKPGAWGTRQLWKGQSLEISLF
jgi:hypothetical protein